MVPSTCPQPEGATARLVKSLLCSLCFLHLSACSMTAHLHVAHLNWLLLSLPVWLLMNMELLEADNEPNAVKCKTIHFNDLFLNTQQHLFAYFIATSFNICP